MNFRRATEGELARSINTLDGVKSSRVHIVMPQEAIFQEDNVPDEWKEYTPLNAELCADLPVITEKKASLAETGDECEAAAN